MTRPPSTRDIDDAVPALRPSGLWSRLNSPLPFPISIRGSVRSLFRRRAVPWQDVVRSSALPIPVMQTIALIVRRTRLWPSEQSDVARELCTHFADGLASGTQPDELCRTFGQPKAVAKLIRAAKRRGRPLWWQTWHYTLKAVGYAVLLMLTVYVVLAWMYFSATPALKRNYAAEINAGILATPEASRAWPTYAAALKDLGQVPQEITRNQADSRGSDGGSRTDSWPQKPGDERWPMAAAWVGSKQEAIRKIREAAAMPNLGFPLWDQAPENYRRLQPSSGPNPALHSVLLPYLGELRQMVRVLTVDARLAAQERDADRFVADIRAMCGIARHCDEVQTLINKLVQAAILSLAFETMKGPIAEDFLSAAHLRDLAHTIAAFDDGVLRMSLALEKQFFEDTVQRTYSDNGSGDGHMTHEGLKVIETLAGYYPGTQEPEQRLIMAAGGPLSVAGMASRKDLLAEADRLYGLSAEESELPLWKRGTSKLDAEILRIEEGAMSRFRYRMLTILLPAFNKVSHTIETARQNRDGILVALAVESHRRAHGSYPASLEAIVPSFLPAIPPDRYDGMPIKYRLVESASTTRPIVYSIGVDRIDDGGRGPKAPVDPRNIHAFKPPAEITGLLADPRQRDQFSGDWILYKPE